MKARGRLLRDARGDHHRLGSRLPRAAVGAATLTLLTATVGSARGDVAVVKPIYPDNAQQEIDGFGASSAWTGANMSDADAAFLFSKDTGIGLSLLRAKIQTCDLSTSATCVLTTNELNTAQLAQKYGARVWAAPWSPPAAWKLGANPDAGLDGGTLDPAHYQDWAQALVAFVQSMKTSGVDLIALSAQNEPDLGVAPYESCGYQPAALANFIVQALAPAFQKASLIGPGSSFRLMGPETIGFPGFAAYTPALASADAGPVAASFLGILATHQYGPIASPLSATVTNLKKPLWQTEVYQQDVPADVTMATGLWVAQHMYEALVVDNVSAWHFWWIYSMWNDPSNADSQGLWDGPSQSWSKRAYVMGNYSKFVRPGFVRMATTSPASTGVEVTAFRDPGSNGLVVVATNPGMSDVQQTFVMDGATTASWSAWVTSPTDNLVQQSDSIVGGNSFDYTLKGQSVTTLVGVVTGAGPAYIPPMATPSPSAQASSSAQLPGMAKPPSMAAPAPAAQQGSESSGLACSVRRGLTRADARTGVGAFAGFVLFLAVRRSRRRSI